jgi:hypothetical protein
MIDETIRRREMQYVDGVCYGKNKKKKKCVSSYYTEEQYAEIRTAIKLVASPNAAAFIEKIVLEKVKQILARKTRGNGK